MAIALLNICQWSGDRLIEQTVEDPDWDQIVAAIRQLDNQAFSDLYLQPDADDPEYFLGVCGGAGSYLVTGASVDGEFPTLVDLDRPEFPQRELMAGGQIGLFPNNWIVSLERALQGALAFHEAGGFELPGIWTIEV